MKTNYRNETDIEQRERALQLLEKAKNKEKKKGLMPLHLKDEDNTVVMVSPKLNGKQREKLRNKLKCVYAPKRTEISEYLKM